MNSVPSDHPDPRSETKRWIERAARVMSSRQSNVRALPEPSIFLDRGYGQRVWDVDGNEYLDFAIAMGPGIWGHGNREYLDVIHEQLEKLVYVQSGACQTRLEVELAEQLVEHIPSAERVRFHLSGSEAVQMTLRLSRAFTGRPLFVRFAGHYHGWLDNVVGGVMNADPDARPHALATEQDPFYTAGKATGALQESFLLPWNDLGALERVLEKHASEIAVVMMEVFNSNGGGCPPRPGYLEGVRELCTRYGVLLCFDEIITGFRTALGGAQSIVGVTPDVSIFGKAIAGGMPLAAIVGRRDMFEQFRTNKVIGAGTFNAFPVAMAAGLATVRLLARDGGAYYRTRNHLQARLAAGLRAAAERHGHSLLVQGMPGSFCTHFTTATTLWNHSDFTSVDVAKGVRFRALLREQGVIQGLGSRWFVSFAFSETDCDETLERADRALACLS